MKKQLITQTMLFLTFIVGYGQTSKYHPFPDSVGIWNEHVVTSTSSGYYSYGIFGDTVLNSINYHKLYIHSLSLSVSDTAITQSNSTFIGGIREYNKSVYFCNKNWMACCGQIDSTYLLYDFSKQVGDTIKFENPQMGYSRPYLILNSIDSVLVNNDYRKRYNLLGETWIEGIGSLRDLLSSILGIPTCYCTNEMVCYKYGDTTCYLNPKFHDCYPYLGNNTEDYSMQEKITISPNPFSSQTILQSNKVLKDVTLTIYNSHAQIVKQIKNISGQTIILDRDNLTSGLYFLRLTEKDKTYLSEKILIINN
jgi:hypothetical protein